MNAVCYKYNYKRSLSYLTILLNLQHIGQHQKSEIEHKEFILGAFRTPSITSINITNLKHIHLLEQGFFSWAVTIVNCAVWLAGRDKLCDFTYL